MTLVCQTSENECAIPADYPGAGFLLKALFIPEEMAVSDRDLHPSLGVWMNKCSFIVSIIHLC